MPHLDENTSKLQSHNDKSQSVLMIDIGGSHVKLKCGKTVPGKRFESGPDLSATVMAERVKALASDWRFDVVSIGYPGVVKAGQSAAEPGNLGPGWVGFDFQAAFDRPVRVINDAALQALAAYSGGRMLFIGLGTGAGGAFVVDGLIAPIELGEMRLTRTDTLADCLAKDALKGFGEAQWKDHVFDALALLQRVFCPDEIVVGGGNVERLGELPRHCRAFSNEDAYLGALRLWGHGGVTAIAQPSSWRFEADWR